MSSKIKPLKLPEIVETLSEDQQSGITSAALGISSMVSLEKHPMLYLRDGKTGIVGIRRGDMVTLVDKRGEVIDNPSIKQRVLEYI